MKIVYICIASVMLILLCGHAEAAEYTYEKNEGASQIVVDGWEKLLEELPDGLREEADDIDPVISGSFREKIGLSYWLGKIVSGFADSWGVVFPGIFQLFSMMLVMAAVELSIEFSPSAGLRKSFQMLSALASSVLLFGMTDRIMEGAEAYLGRICGVMNTLTPVMEGLYLAEGNLTQKAVTTEAVMIAVTLVGNFTGKILAPLTNLLFALSCLGSVCTDVKIGGFTGSLRKLIMRLWQFGTLLFSFLLSVQSILAKSADSLAAKTARFAISSFIPMAGGVIAEAFSTLKEGTAVLRNAAGIGGMIVILLILIPGILPLVLYKCGLSLAETAAESMSLSGMRGMLGDIHGIVDMLFGFVLYTSLMFLLVLIIFTKAQAGG